MVRRKSQARSYSGRSGSSSKTPDASAKPSRTEVVVRKYRRKPGTVALQEIKRLRKSTKLLIPKSVFSRVVREIVIDLFPRLDIRRMQASALEALQEAAEMYLTQFFEDAVLLTFHAKRVTLMRHDMILMRRLRGRDDTARKLCFYCRMLNYDPDIQSVGNNKEMLNITQSIREYINGHNNLIREVL